MTLRKRSLSLNGHRTSIALEPEFWREIDLIAQASGLSLAASIASIDAGRGDRPLASALRLAVLSHLKLSCNPVDPVSLRQDDRSQ